MAQYRQYAWLLAACLAATGCNLQAAKKPRLGEADRLPRLETVRPERTRLTVRSELTARVDALEKAELCAQVRGVVETIPADVDIGRSIKAGEALVTLAIPDLKAELEHKKALLEQARNQKDQAVQNRIVAVQEVKEAAAQE